MKIRLETENDYLEVENLVRNSFWNVYRPGAFEHYIVHHLRNDESFINDLAYVIECDGKIRGHINYSVGFIEYGDEKMDAVVLGPIAIDKDYQNMGLGSKLIEYTLYLAKGENIQVISPQTSFVMIKLLEQTVNNGGYRKQPQNNIGFAEKIRK